MSGGVVFVRAVIHGPCYICTVRICAASLVVSSFKSRGWKAGHDAGGSLNRVLSIGSITQPFCKTTACSARERLPSPAFPLYALAPGPDCKMHAACQSTVCCVFKGMGELIA
jgi:hypothetical protein